jgi:hypothetical protein
LPELYLTPDLRHLAIYAAAIISIQLGNTRGALHSLPQIKKRWDALGFAYSLGQGSVGRKVKGQIQADNPCRICGFQTKPPHDARKHRFSKAKKRPFNAKELTDLGLRKI